MGEVPRSSLLDCKTNCLISYTGCNFGNFKKFFNTFKNLATEFCLVPCPDKISQCVSSIEVLLLSWKASVLCCTNEWMNTVFPSFLRQEQFFFPPKQLRKSFTYAS